MLVILPWHMSIDTEQMGNPSPILIPTPRRLLLAQTQKDTLMVRDSVSESLKIPSHSINNGSKNPFHLTCYFPLNVFSLVSRSQSSFSGQPAPLTIPQMVTTDFPVLPH